MSGYVVAAIVIVLVWMLIGLTLSVVMGRRGHMGWGWGILGAMLGPLAVVAAIATARHEDEDRPAVIAPAQERGGPVDVLVGIDGSSESHLALGRILALLGPRLGRLCLATVLPFEDVPAHRAKALADLDRHAQLSGVAEAGQELLYGSPAQALADFAVAEGYALLVVGTRGAGISKAVVGSTASSLAAGSPVPVLMVSAGQGAASAAA